MKAIILCAGYGTRLGKLTREIPKPMLPIKGKPLLEYTVRYLAKQGINQLAINLHYMPEKIKTYFRNGEKFGVSITYFYEPKLLGTAGAVRNMAKWLEDAEDVAVLYGDLLIDQDLITMHNLHKEKSALATVLLHQRYGSNSLVKMDAKNRITDFIERPTEEQREKSPHPWVNSGVCIVKPRILNVIPSRTPSDLPKDVFVDVLDTESLYGFPLQGFRCAIDSLERLEQANKAVENGEYKI